MSSPENESQSSDERRRREEQQQRQPQSSQQGQQQHRLQERHQQPAREPQPQQSASDQMVPGTPSPGELMGVLFTARRIMMRHQRSRQTAVLQHVATQEYHQRLDQNLAQPKERRESLPAIIRKNVKIIKKVIDDILEDPSPGKFNTLRERIRRPFKTLSTIRRTPARSMSRTPGPHVDEYYTPTLQVAPRFISVPKDRTVTEKTNVRLQCGVAGHPAPWATWDRDGQILTSTDRLSLIEQGNKRIFHLLEAKQEDAGIYRITIENDYGGVEVSIRLDVKSVEGIVFPAVRSSAGTPPPIVTTRRPNSRSMAVELTDISEGSSKGSEEPSSLQIERRNKGLSKGQLKRMNEEQKKEQDEEKKKAKMEKESEDKYKEKNKNRDDDDGKRDDEQS